MILTVWGTPLWEAPQEGRHKGEMCGASRERESRVPGTEEVLIVWTSAEHLLIQNGSTFSWCCKVLLVHGTSWLRQVRGWSQQGLWLLRVECQMLGLQGLELPS